METNELNAILKAHKKWLNNDYDGIRANLRRADLCRANLCGADLCEADLRGADLCGADIDYASWPLWCSSLRAYVDDRIAIQLLYHTLSVVQHSPYVSDEIKRVLLDDANITIANRFHHIDECGKLNTYRQIGQESKT